MMRIFAIVLAAGCLTWGPAPAQIVIQRPQAPGPAPAPQAEPQEGVPALVQKLADDKGWWEARGKLVRLAAQGQHMAILRALQASWFAHEEPALRARTKAVADEINRAHLEELKAKELRERLASAKAALEVLQAALGGEGEPAIALAAAKAAAVKLAAALEGLQQSADSKLPLGIRRQLGPPGAGIRIEVPPPGAGPGKKEGVPEAEAGEGKKVQGGSRL